MGRAVAVLGAVGAEDLAEVGGKGANLGELVRGGFPVPAGFVVGSGAYLAASAEAGLAADVAIPDRLRAAVVEAYECLGAGPVAVRSSAVAEDLPGASFAGQHDSFLNVIGADAVLEAVRRCWNSLWSERAVAYRQPLAVPPDQVRMAVVVQAMVQAEFAGVMFTANPVTGERGEVVVAASPGLGESVVSGLGTPDHFLVDGNGRIREHTAGSVGADTARLPDAIALELAALGRSVAGHFGRPQDLEWAYAAGRVWLVQTRPMTALPPPPLHLNRLARLIGRDIAETLPVRPYPMDVTTVTGAALRSVERLQYELCGLRIDLLDALRETDGVVDRLVPPAPCPTVALLAAPMRNWRRRRRYDPARWTADPRFGQIERGLAELTARDPASLPWAELVRVPSRAVELFERHVDLWVDYEPGAAAAPGRLRMALTALGLRALAPSLILGVRSRTEDCNDALAELAAVVRADPAASTAFAEVETDALADALLHDTGLTGFRAAFEAFLAEYGHRETISGLLASSPTWREAPATVLTLVGLLLEEPPGAGAPNTPPDAASRRVAEHRLVRLARRGPAMQRRIEAARAAIAWREDSHFHVTRVVAPLRASLLEIGRHLAVADVLSDRQEIFHLRLEELEALGEPDRMTSSHRHELRALVRARAAARAGLAGVPLIAAATLFPPAPRRTGDLVVGTAASGGRATGPVCLVRDPAEFGKLRAGDVLVCPYTNPAWTPLFRRAVAVVIDGGSVASHAAIVAREYGIPAVVATGTGTSVLAEGQAVTVDGDTGRVRAATG